MPGNDIGQNNAASTLTPLMLHCSISVPALSRFFVRISLFGTNTLGFAAEMTCVVLVTGGMNEKTYLRRGGPTKRIIITLSRSTLGFYFGPI